jgi:predicted nucleic acid-binding Zn ribbon protein
MEEIHTGGLKKFVSKGKGPEMDKELARKIDEGYEKAEIRKQKERKRKIVIIVISILLLILICYLIFK